MIDNNIYSRVHFWVGNVYRFLSAGKYQRTIKVNDTRTIFGASFGTPGWHHIRETLKEYDDNRRIDYRETSMYAFLKYFTPKSIEDFIDDDNLHKCTLPLFTYPWGTFLNSEISTEKNPFSSRFCGPSSDFFIQKEFFRTIALYEHMKEKGYQPWYYGHSFIGGTFLVNLKGEKCFVVLQGNHRTAILAHLGYTELVVRNVPGYMHTVSEVDISKWICVESGMCSIPLARNVMKLFFDYNGQHIKERLTLLTQDSVN